MWANELKGSLASPSSWMVAGGVPGVWEGVLGRVKEGEGMAKGKAQSPGFS